MEEAQFRSGGRTLVKHYGVREYELGMPTNFGVRAIHGYSRSPPASFCIQTKRRCIQTFMRPSFTGLWKLIRGDSDFGFLPPPELRVDAIVHEDPQLHIRTRQKDANGDVIIDRHLTIGGGATKIIILGRARRVRASWDEAVLVVETSSEVSGKTRRTEDRWTLDAEAGWLTIERLHEQPGGPVRQHLRLRRRVECSSVTLNSTFAGGIKA